MGEDTSEKLGALLSFVIKASKAAVQIHVACKVQHYSIK